MFSYQIENYVYLTTYFRRTRTHSMNGRIGDEVHEGVVKFFCRSRGHGFMDDDDVSLTIF